MAVKLMIGIWAALVRTSRIASNALNGCATIGDMPSLPAVDSLAHSALLADVERIIAEVPNRPRFTKIIEVIHAEATRQARDRFFIVASIAGIVSYDLFLFADSLIIGDQMWLLSALQLGAVTPLSILMVVLVARGKLDCGAPSFVVLTAMMTTTLVGLRMVEGEYAMLFACVLNLMIIASNLLVAVPFVWAVGYTVLTNIVIAIVLLCHPSIETNAALFVIIMTLTASMYSVVGHYRIDAGVRGAFLFTLVERLRSDQLTVSNRQLNALAGIDGLTGIGNRRAFDRVMSDLCGRSGVGLVLIDIDHFKLLNDRHGHLIGDACLRQVASVLVDRMPDARHVPARYGGEEFAIIITDGDAQSTFAVAEDIRLAIASTLLATNNAGEAIRATVSIGCASLPASPTASSVSLIAAADDALYEAKRSGRNRTRVGRVDAPRTDTVTATKAMVSDAA